MITGLANEIINESFTWWVDKLETLFLMNCAATNSFSGHETAMKMEHYYQFIQVKAVLIFNFRLSRF